MHETLFVHAAAGVFRLDILDCITIKMPNLGLNGQEISLDALGELSTNKSIKDNIYEK